jgi:hypothetical protein
MLVQISNASSFERQSDCPMGRFPQHKTTERLQNVLDYSTAYFIFFMILTPPKNQPHT